MKQVIVGTYDIGHEQVQIVLREGVGGQFWTIPEKGSVPRIKIGADYDYFEGVIMVLLHEAMELRMDRIQCRYSAEDDMGRDHAEYRFFMTHPQYQDCCAKTAELMAACYGDLHKAWRQWKKGGKKK